MAAKKLSRLMSSSEPKENRAAVSRIKQLVEAENAKIQQTCLEIGKKYAELHRDDYEEAFSPLMQQIAAAQENLSELSVQLQIATGIVTCSNCGNKAPKGSVFCNMCGTKLPEINFDAYETCKKCGGLMKKGAAECPHCGRPADVNQNLVQCAGCKEFVGKDNRFCPVCGASLQEGAPEAPAEKKCPNPSCGAVMDSGKLFCTECGTKLS